MLRIVFICLSVVFTFIAHAKQFSESELTRLAQQFVQAKNAKQQPDSSETDVDHFLSLIVEDFVDEHIKYNVTTTSKSKLKTNLMAKLEDQIVSSSIEVSDMLVGGNSAFIKMIETGKVKPAHLDKVIEYKSTNIVSLEFDDSGLIKHIRRHHGF